MNIAIIDDSPSILIVFKQCLEELNLNVYTFQNPLVALVEIPKLNIDIVISDYLMFDMVGIEVINRLKNILLHKVKYILCTSFPDEKIETYCIENDIKFLDKKNFNNFDILKETLGL